MEERVKKIFEDVFHMEDPDGDTHFSKMGGKSVDAMKLQIELRRLFGVKVDFRTLYELGSIQSIATYVADHATGQRQA